ncbi:uncharacterized protein TNCV_3093931 [Trichonephila clavipes]|nr:uncharacterized protein TNCV_3093931 [Trichonephila clavipes]
MPVRYAKKAVWAVYFHIRSSDEEPLHSFCPVGPNSWCKYQNQVVEGSVETFRHSNKLPVAVMDAIKPVFNDLSQPKLLQKCLGKSNVSILLFVVGVERVRIDIVFLFGTVTVSDSKQQWSSDNYLSCLASEKIFEENTRCPQLNDPTSKLSTDETIVQKVVKCCVRHTEEMGICLRE